MLESDEFPTPASRVITTLPAVFKLEDLFMAEELQSTLVSGVYGEEGGDWVESAALACSG